MGGAVPLSDSGMNEGTNSFVLSLQNGEGVGTVLVEFGVFALSTARRSAAEAVCAAVRVQPVELRDLLGYIREGEPVEGTARRYMAAIVSDETKLRDAVEGLRAFRRAQAAMARVTKPQEPEDTGPAHMANLPLGSPTCPCMECAKARAKATPAEPWDHDRMCRVAWCRVNGDKRPMAEVAAELGVSDSTLGAMLDRGRVLSEPRPELLGVGGSMKKAERDAKVERERAKEFANASRPERMRLLRGGVS